MLILCEKEAKIFKLFKYVTSVLLHSNVQNRKLESWHWFACKYWLQIPELLYEGFFDLPVIVI